VTATVDSAQIVVVLLQNSLIINETILYLHSVSIMGLSATVWVHIVKLQIIMPPN